MAHLSEFNIPPLLSSFRYVGPYSGHDNLCQCNTVVYSLMSACSGCQGSTWISYAFYPTRKKLAPMMTSCQVVSVVIQLYCRIFTFYVGALMSIPYTHAHLSPYFP